MSDRAQRNRKKPIPYTPVPLPIKQTKKKKNAAVPVAPPPSSKKRPRTPNTGAGAGAAPPPKKSTTAPRARKPPPRTPTADGGSKLKNNAAAKACAIKNPWEMGAIYILDKIAKATTKGLTDAEICRLAEEIKRKNLFRDADKKNNTKSKFVVTRTNDELLDFFMIMWLDGKHDSYIDDTFPRWLELQTTISTSVFYEGPTGGPRSKILSELIALAVNGTIGPYFKNIFAILADVKKIPPLLVESGEDKDVKPSRVFTKQGDMKKSDVLTFEKIQTMVQKIKALMSGKTIIQNATGKSVKISLDRWERIFKYALVSKHDFGIEKQQVPGLKRNDKGPNSVWVSIDQEFSSQQERALSKLVTSSVSKRNKTGPQYEHDPAKNMLTIGSLLDPGRTMVPSGPLSLLQEIGLKKDSNKSTILNLTNRFFLGPFDLNIKSTNGTSMFHFTITLEDGEITVRINDKKLDLPTTAGTAQKTKYDAKKANIELKKLQDKLKNSKNPANAAKIQNSINKKNLFIRTKGESEIDLTVAIGKWAGDATQALINSFQLSKPIRIHPTRPGSATIYNGSGDSLELLEYDMFYELKNNKNGSKPPLLIDFSAFHAVKIAHLPWPAGISSRNVVLNIGEESNVGGGNSKMVNNESANSGGTVVATTTKKYEELIREIAGQNKTLLKNINPVFKNMLFGTRNNSRLNIQLSGLNNSQLSQLKNLVSANKISNFKTTFNTFRKGKARAAKAGLTATPGGRAAAAAMQVNNATTAGPSSPSTSFKTANSMNENSFVTAPENSGNSTGSVTGTRNNKNRMNENNGNSGKN